MAKGVGDVLYSILSNDTNISGIVSTKIYPFLAIEDVVYPYIVYTIEGVDPTQTDDGVSILDVNSANIEIYSEDLSEIETLSKYVRNALDRYRGTVEGIEVQSISFRSENGGYADADRVYVKIQDYSLRMVTAACMFGRVTDLSSSTISTSQINLSWSDGATGEANWEIWTSQDFINWTLVDTIASDSTSYSVTGLTSQTSYSYKVRAIDSTDKGEWSNIVQGCTESAITPKVGIEYPSHYGTNQTISYALYDEGWNNANIPQPTPPINPISVARLTDFFTLENNNAFGNTDRFTDINGLQVYADDYVIDHYRNRGWYRVPLTTGLDWNGTISQVNSSTQNGYTDWRLPDAAESMEILNNANSSTLNYSPFNITFGNYWNSTTRVASSAQAYYFAFNAMGGFVFSKTQTLFDHLLIRTHYT